jgi:hypothetical protein
MPHVPREHITLFADRVAMLGSVQLSADVIFEVFRMASQYQTMRFTLEQIRLGSKSNVDYASWAGRTIEADDQSRKRLKLRHPRRRLITLDEI